MLARVPRPVGVSLWSHLRATQGEDALAPLRGLLNAADFSTPYRYLEAILSGPMDGRRKLAARLGEEARDAIDELLNAALGFEADDHPSLQRFIDWFDRGDADIKRELAESGDMVRVMTVHGSKGLEAPVVILADAAFDPARRPRGAVLELSIGDAALPLVPPTRAEANATIAEARDRSNAADMEEHWRLLYVGMTRAEETLVVTGALGPAAKGEPAELSWHATVERAMVAMGAEVLEAGGLGWTGREVLPDALEPRGQALTAEREIALPSWLSQPAPMEARPRDRWRPRQRLKMTRPILRPAPGCSPRQSAGVSSTRCSSDCRTSRPKIAMGRRIAGWREPAELQMRRSVPISSATSSPLSTIPLTPLCSRTRRRRGAHCSGGRRAG